MKSINKVEIAVSAETQCGIVPPKSILVVEDDHHLRQHVVDILVQAGYAVTSAVDGDAGWEELQLNRYDLIITDNQMPKMTGLEMVEKMRCASMSQPVIMVTGCMPPRVFAREPWLQIVAALERPFYDEELLETVKKSCSGTTTMPPPSKHESHPPLNYERKDFTN